MNTSKAVAATGGNAIENQRWHHVSRRLTRKGFGIIILLLYLRLVSILFQSPSTAFPSPVHAWLVIGCSFLNVLSHTAVVADMLNEGFVVSILVGVSFDLASSLLYLWCSKDLARSAFSSLWSMGLVAYHVRALLCFRSFDSMKSVVTAATNNLRGDPGPFGLDHLFAYTDLGNHIAFFLLAVRQTMEAGTDSFPKTVGLAALIFVPSMLLIQRILKVPDQNENPSPAPSSRKAPAAELAVLKNRSATPVCNCRACRSETSFSIAPQFCELWFCTFQELLRKIEKAQKIS